VARASRSIEIQVSPEAFSRVVQDYASYPEFVPEVKGVRLGPSEGGAVEVTYLLDVKLKIYEFTLRHEPRGPLRIEWQLVRGGDFMRRNLGSWTFERTKSGGTRATYSIDIELAMVPQNFEKALAERGLPNLLSNFKARAERLQP
jgi:ribosome-associated toxin RatA of RatAB toxin-antitoxin module